MKINITIIINPLQPFTAAQVVILRPIHRIESVPSDKQRRETSEPEMFTEFTYIDKCYIKRLH